MWRFAHAARIGLADRNQAAEAGRATRIGRADLERNVMSIHSSSRAGALAASAVLICFLLGDASAMAAAAAAAGAAGGAGAGAAAGAAGAGHAPASAGGNGAPVITYDVAPPNYPGRHPGWHRQAAQKARDACPLEFLFDFPHCQQDAF